MNAEEKSIKLQSLKKGEAFTYHKGLLAYDKRKNEELKDLGNLAMLLQKNQVVTLVQRRLTEEKIKIRKVKEGDKMVEKSVYFPGKFAYIAIGLK